VLILLVVVVGAVLFARFVRSHGLPSTGPAVGVSPGPLAATAVTGHVTGTLPASCHERTAANGQPLPDPACTPGVVSTAVSQANLDTTICRPGYTKTARPPESDTGSFKKKIIVSYHESGPLSDYELDHLVSLELAGSNDAGNLWPQRNDHPAGAINSKDPVENALNKAVCTYQVTLTAAQTAIAGDWTTALARLGLPAAG
jgi:hypothetical protein